VTDVAIPDPRPTPAPPTDLQAWVRDAGAAHQLATSLCKTSFAPKAYRGKPEEGAAAILAGIKWGLDPITALSAFDDIQGTPAPKAITLRAVVQAAGHDIEYTETGPTRVVARGRRYGSETWVESVWTIERAEQAGFTAKNPNYKTQPQSMLTARATAEVARLVASDVVLGIGAYSAEELQDEGLDIEVRPDRSTAAAILAADPLPAHDPDTAELVDTPGEQA
jgi:hypothetical protein